MEIILLPLLMFGIISWVAGVAGKEAKNKRPVNYQKTGNQAYNTSSNDGRFEMKRDNLTDLRERMKKAIESGNMNANGNSNSNSQNNPPRTSSAGRGYSRVKSTSGMRGGNNPLNKQSFHHHEESSAFILDEETESIELWSKNRMIMQKINDDFNRFVVAQHNENQRMMKQCRSVDR